jgi:hypothetical protein
VVTGEMSTHDDDDDGEQDSIDMLKCPSTLGKISCSILSARAGYQPALCKYYCFSSILRVVLRLHMEKKRRKA